MNGQDLLSNARSLLAAASSVESSDLRVLYTAKARSMYTQLVTDVEMFGRELAAVESAPSEKVAS